MSTLEQLIEKIGRDTAARILETHIRENSDTTLTIVANRGVHHLPSQLERGEVFYASEGSLDFSSIDAVNKQYVSILSAAASKLKSKKWSKIYLVPFGHNSLIMQLKLLIYRITHIESVDIFYDGKGNYYDLAINQREIIVLSAEDASNERAV